MRLSFSHCPSYDGIFAHLDEAISLESKAEWGYKNRGQSKLCVDTLQP